MRSWLPEAAFPCCPCSSRWSMIARTGPSSASWPTARSPSPRSLPAGAASTQRRCLALAHRCSLRIRDGAWRCTAAPAGSPGCGVIAPVIVPSPDGRRVSWVDFCDYVGVFVSPGKAVGGDEGTPWDLPDLHFDREQYIAEIERASRDGSWETDRRKTARLVYERLEPL